MPWPIRAVQALGDLDGGQHRASASWRAWPPGPSPSSTSTGSRTWGLFANLAVAPISSFLMMPGAGAGRGADPAGAGDRRRWRWRGGRSG